MSRGRGSYGPLDRDRNWIASWTADQATDYARDRTVGAALRPVMPAVGNIYAAHRSAKQAWRGFRGAGGRVNAEKSPTQIGQDLFHTGDDRDRAIAQLSTAFLSLTSDIGTWTLANTSDPDIQAIVQWIEADITPALAEWRAFVDQEKSSWWTKVATSWDTYERWWERIKNLRSLARANGIALQSAEPTPLPKTIWQLSETGKGSEFVSLLGVAKIGVLGVLGIMGVAGLWSALRGFQTNMRGERVDS